MAGTAYKYDALTDCATGARRKCSYCSFDVFMIVLTLMGRQMYFYYLEWLFVYNQNKSGYLQITTLQVYYF